MVQTDMPLYVYWSPYTFQSEITGVGGWVLKLLFFLGPYSALINLCYYPLYIQAVCGSLGFFCMICFTHFLGKKKAIDNRAHYLKF